MRVHPVKQNRSRATLQRLLDAAEAALNSGGLEAATVPDIASRAGMSVGVVYRRFRDKDALLRAVFERFFTKARDSNRAALNAANWSQCGVAEIVASIITGMVGAYRSRKGLLRALVIYIETHGDQRFRRRANDLMNATFSDVIALLTDRSRRREIRHEHPQAAIELMLVMVGSTLRRVILDGHAVAFEAASDSSFVAELTSACLAYLGVPFRRG